MTDAMRDRFEELRDLGPNWDSYNAVPITPEAIDAGLRLYDAVGVKPWVVPVAHGGVQLEWDDGPRYFEAEWKPGEGWGFYTRVTGPDGQRETETTDAITHEAVLARVERFLAEWETVA